MDYEDDDHIPTDLITKSQIGFRQLAGLSSFNPTLDPLPTTTSIESLIPTLENYNSNSSSNNSLQCKYCHAKLLRDSLSLICIYCGNSQIQHDGVHPAPLNFNSTVAYTWLLQSLYFNGSERVGSLAEVSEINGTQSPAEDELTLSELLDLQILWRDEPKKPNSNLTIINSESSTNLGSADLDFFIASKRDVVSNVSEEQPVASTNDQTTAFEGQANRTSVTSTIDPTDDASADWNAEFQSAVTKMVNENPNSVDLFVGAEPDLSSRIDAGSGEMKVFNNKAPNDESDPFPSMGKDTTQDDLFANMSSATFQQTERLDSVQTNDGTSDHLSDDNSKGADGDWFSDDHWQKSGINSTAVSNQADQLDLFGQPNDTSSQDNPNVSSANWFENTNWQNSSANTASQQADQLDLFDKLNDESLHNNDPSIDGFENIDWQKTTVTAVSLQVDQLELAGKDNDGYSQDNSNELSADWFENTDWQKNTPNSTAASQQAGQLDFVGKLNDGSSRDIPNDSSLDWFENTSWQKSTSKNTAPIIGENLFDNKQQNDQVSSPSLVNDLIHSENSDLDNLNVHRSDATTDWFQDSHWPTGASHATSNMVGNEDDDDGFDEWNDFTSSTGNLDSKQSEKVGAADNMPALNLFPSSTADPQVNIDDLVANKTGDDGFDEWNFTSSNQDPFPDSQKHIGNEKVGSTADPKEDFGDFFQSDLFSGSSSNKNQNDTQAVYDIFSGVSMTSRTANAEAGNSVEGSKNDEITSSATIIPKADVQILLSQMHDLSFMLKSELSIPSKPDDLDISHSK
uniref:uncharacterized protein LOC122590505 n=1 Tax=Erigeron canadensis TaxID=72917 RepID=UPI001CB9CFAD|nr:uncharacterized protein LOC122590505 [Erigeron canadensis]